MNTNERCELVRAMEMLVRTVNNEDFIMEWLMNGVADGDIQPDTTDDELEYYIEDTAFADLMDTFLHIMKNAYKDGGLYFDGIVSKPESKLPEQCYSILSSSNEIIIIKRNEKGYYATDIPTQNQEDARALVDEYNRKLGVSKAQEEAMKAGSMFGWNVPVASPEYYDIDGNPIKQKG